MRTLSANPSFKTAFFNMVRLVKQCIPYMLYPHIIRVSLIYILSSLIRTGLPVFFDSIREIPITTLNKCVCIVDQSRILY